MTANTIVVRGIVKPNGALELEGTPQLPVGPVEVVVRALSPNATTEEGWWPCLQRIRAEREAAGYHFLNEAEMQTHLSWLRDDEDRIDRLHRELEQGQASEGRS